MRPTDGCHPNENVYPYLARSRHRTRLSPGDGPTRLWAPSRTRTGDPDGSRHPRSLRRVSLVGCRGRCLPAVHRGDRASDTPVTNRPLQLVSFDTERYRAIRRGRLVRPPRDRKTMRDDPECLPSSGTLRSGRGLLSVKRGAPTARTRGYARAPRGSSGDALAPPWAFTPDPKALVPRPGPDHDHRFAGREKEAASCLRPRHARSPFTCADAPFWGPDTRAYPRPGVA